MDDKSFLRASISKSGTSLSILFRAMTLGVSLTPSSLRIALTESACSAAYGSVMSTKWSKIEAEAISSSVALKAAISVVGNFWINPTVSVIRTSVPPGSWIRLVTGSRVQKS